jgi:NADH:quinone reductase (non-electrogenic)
VASQEGKYLGRKLSKLGKQEPILKQNGISATDEAVSAPFEYKHLGSLAYIGNAAVFDLGQNYSFMGGLVRLNGFHYLASGRKIVLTACYVCMAQRVLERAGVRPHSRVVDG